MHSDCCKFRFKGKCKYKLFASNKINVIVSNHIYKYFQHNFNIVTINMKQKNYLASMNFKITQI